jgi:hypothetical protein
MECVRNDMLRKRGRLFKLRYLREMMVAVRLEIGMRIRTIASFAAVLSIAVSAYANQCRTIKLNPAPRIFNRPAWSASGDHLLLVDVVAGEIESYSLSGNRERSIIRPGQDQLDFSRPNAIVSTPSGYMIMDGGSRFVLLDRVLAPTRAFNIGGDPPLAWDAAPFNWAPTEGGLVAYGDLRAPNAPWKTGLFRVSWGDPLKFEFLKEMPNGAAREPYLLESDYVVRAGQRAYLLAFEPAYGVFEVDGRRLRLLTGLPAGFGSLPPLPESHGRSSMAILYAALARTKSVSGLLVAGDRLYVLLRDVSAGRRRWLLAEYDPLQQKTVAILNLPTSSEHVEVAAGNKWLAIVEKGPFLADERFAPGNVILVPVTALNALHEAGGSVVSPKDLCGR